MGGGMTLLLVLAALEWSVAITLLVGRFCGFNRMENDDDE
jgi:hypothetical protein